MKYDLRGAPLMQESHFDEIRPFLTGETLDTNFSFPITHVDVKTPTDRVTFLGSLLENKTVLHIGCADHLDVICLLYTSPSPRDMRRSRMPSSA